MDGLCFFGFGFVGITDDSRDHLVFVGCAGDHDDASLGLELVEDEFHDGFEQLAVVHDAGGDGGECVDDAEVIDRRFAGVCIVLGIVGDVGCDVGIAGRGDPCFDFGFEIEIVGDEHGWFSDAFGWITKEQDSCADTDFITTFEADAVDDCYAVDEGTVL